MLAGIAHVATLFQPRNIVAFNARIARSEINGLTLDHFQEREGSP